MGTTPCRAIIWAILTFLALPPAHAQTQAAPESSQLTLESEDLKTSDMVPVSWFQPRRSGSSEILFMGKTLPRTKLYLLNPYIVKTENGQQTQLFLEEDQVVNLPSQADEEGVFSFQFRLDAGGHYQADVVFVHPEEVYQKSTSFHLTFETKGKEILLWAAEVNMEEKVDSLGVEKNLTRVGIYLFPDHKNLISLTVGTTLLSYQKKSAEIPMDAKVSSTQNAFYQIGYERKWKEDLLATVDLTHSSGRVSSGPEVQVVDGEYTWMRFKPALNFYPAKFVIRNTPLRQIRGALIGGLTYESLPYLKSVNQFAEQEMAEAQFMTLFLGTRFDFRHHSDWKWWSQLLLHSPPFTLGGAYEIRGSLATDFSLGADYVLPDRRWSLGAQLDFHWRKLNSFEPDVFVNQEIEADQDFSTLAAGLKVTHAF